MNKNSIGELVVVAYKAKDLPNREIVGKQDPFVVFRFGEATEKTRTDYRGGQNPIWDDQVNFHVPEKKKILTVQIYDEDAKREELISECEVDISKVLEEGELDGWFPLSFKGKPAGEIYLEMTFYSARPPPKRQPTRYGQKKPPKHTSPLPPSSLASQYQPPSRPAVVPAPSESQSTPTANTLYQTPQPSQAYPPPFRIQDGPYPVSTVSTPANSAQQTARPPLNYNVNTTIKPTNYSRPTSTSGMPVTEASKPFTAYPQPNYPSNTTAKPLDYSRPTSISGIPTPEISNPPMAYPQPSSSTGTMNSNLMTPIITTLSNGLQHIRPPQPQSGSFYSTKYNSSGNSRPNSQIFQGSSVFGHISPPQSLSSSTASTSNTAPLLSSSYTPRPPYNANNGYPPSTTYHANNRYGPYPDPQGYPSGHVSQSSLQSNPLTNSFAAHQGSFGFVNPQQSSFHNGNYPPPSKYSPTPMNSYSTPNYSNGYPPY